MYAKTPVQTELAFSSPVVDAVAGDLVDSLHLVLLHDGTVWSRRESSHGILPGGRRPPSSWSTVLGLSDATQIAAGAGTCYALLSDGSVWAWGGNGDGQVGDGSTAKRPTPVQVSGLPVAATQIAAGDRTAYALLSDGSVWAWGGNGDGQVGDGSTVNRLTPVRVSGLTSGVTQIAAGGSSRYALLRDRSLVAWGGNALGQVGDRSTVNQLVPVPVVDVTDVTQIAASDVAAYALTATGMVAAWGFNGNIGDRASVDRRKPVFVRDLEDVTQITTTALAGYALLADGSVKTWGHSSLSADENAVASPDLALAPVGLAHSHRIQGLQ